jgi:hypothetical protein
MPDFPRLADIGRLEILGSTSNGTGVTVTASGTTHTKGSWTEVGRASMDGTMLYVDITTQTATAQDYLVDIGIGPAGSEQVLVPNLLISRTSTSAGAAHYSFPIAVPAGSRISARCQSGVASAALTVSCRIGGGSQAARPAAAAAEAIGISTAATRGTPIDTGAVANTKSAWQIMGYANHDLDQLIVVPGNATDVARSFAYFVVDIGIGPAGSEQVLIPELSFFVEAADDLIFPHSSQPYDLNVPAGTRFSCRARSANVTAGDRTLDIAVYGSY